MLTIDALKEYGANTDEGLKRCFGNEGFYLKLVGMAPKEESFDKLFAAIDSHDPDAGFEAAHALKGVLSNLSLDPIIEPVKEITELLRSREDIDYSPYVEKIKEKLEELKGICE